MAVGWGEDRSRYSSLNRQAKRKRRQGPHPVRPAWEADVERPAESTAERFLRQSPEYRRLSTEVKLRASNRCELHIHKVCTGWGEDPHHVYPTSEGGAVVCPPKWLLWACRACHGYVHGSGRREAERLGLIVPMAPKQEVPGAEES